MQPSQETSMGRLWLLAGVSLAGYAILRAWMPLAPHAAQVARPDVASFAPWPWGVAAYAVLFLALLWVYWQAYRWVLTSKRQVSLAAVLLPAVLFSAVLLGAFPINALDIYNYLLLGRVQAVFGHNPYVVSSAAIPQEIWLAYAGEWGDDISPYGPLFQAAANAIALLSGNNLLAGLLLFKTLAALTMLGSAAMIWLLLAHSAHNQRSAHTLLWAWNPALLLTFAMNGHNDGLMIFWLLLGLWLIQRQHRVLGFAVMVLAPLTKLNGLLPIPFFFLAVVRDLPTGRARARMFLATAAASTLVITVAFLPYGSPLAMLDRLVRTASGASYSPLMALMLAARRLGMPVAWDSAAAAGVLALAVTALWLAWRTWRGRSPLRAAADINVAFTLFSLGFRIWYAVWPFPWLVLDGAQAQGDATQSARDRRVRSFRLRAGVWYLATTQLSVLIYGPIRQAFFGQDHIWGLWIGVLSAFCLPLLLAALFHPREPATRSQG